jgi:hypothetical protein
MDSGAKERAAKRRANAGDWPLRAYAIDAEPLRDPFDRSTVDQRIAAMWSLTREAWSVAGKELPTYVRAAAPGSILRRQP